MMDHRIIQADFDRIAGLSGGGWNHNSHYHEFLLRQLPAHCAEALEIGCGTGAFSRLLAKRSDRVLALDLSPRMIQVARERSRQYPNIEFQIADATAWAYPTERFDCVASIATLHHLPAEDTLSKMREAMKPDGTLIILDLFQGQGLSDVLTSLLAVPVHAGLKLIRTGRLREPRQVREAWAEHGRHDSYPTLSQVRQICAAVLPGAEVRKHLLWRYSITWRKAARPR
ncbi:MAG TPA: class I SAM-dependent methyltransferase [Anaerolineae bacterium]|nr:class I SAM-dependent methyltransferase [Anaerolineae bacterium]